MKDEFPVELIASVRSPETVEIRLVAKEDAAVVSPVLVKLKSSRVNSSANLTEILLESKRRVVDADFAVTFVIISVLVILELDVTRDCLKAVLWESVKSDGDENPVMYTEVFAVTTV